MILNGFENAWVDELMKKWLIEFCENCSKNATMRDDSEKIFKTELWRIFCQLYKMWGIRVDLNWIIFKLKNELNI